MREEFRITPIENRPEREAGAGCRARLLIKPRRLV